MPPWPEHGPLYLYLEPPPQNLSCCVVELSAELSPFPHPARNTLAYRPNAQQEKLPSGNAGLNDAGEANSSANRASESSVDDSIGSPIDVGGSPIGVGNDAGLVVDVDEGREIGGGAISSGTGVDSTSVSSVKDAPSPAFDMSARRANLALNALMRERIKAARFEVKEDLDPVARDFLNKVGVPIYYSYICVRSIMATVWFFQNVSVYKKGHTGCKLNAIPKNVCVQFFLDEL